MTSESSTARLQAMIARACLAADAEWALAAELDGFLRAHELAPEDRAALLAAPRRLGLYRMLVRHNLTTVIEAMLERTVARLERRCPGETQRSIAAFLADVGPRSAHLRDVPGELVAHAAPRWLADPSLPRWLAEHAELELLEAAISAAPRGDAPSGLGEVTIESPLVFAEPLRIARFGWAVHELSTDALDADPVERPVALLVYRDAEHRARVLELSPLAALILERLLAGQPLGGALTSACEADGRPLDDAVLGGAARLLAELGERGVLLGARP